MYVPNVLQANDEIRIMLKNRGSKKMAYNMRLSRTQK